MHVIMIASVTFGISCNGFVQSTSPSVTLFRHEHAGQEITRYKLSKMFIKKLLFPNYSYTRNFDRDTGTDYPPPDLQYNAIPESSINRQRRY